MLHRILFSFLIFITSAANAAGKGDWLLEDLLIGGTIYDATREACSKIEVEDMYQGLAFDNLNAGIFPSNKFNKLTNAISREAFLKNSVYLLDEPTNENRMWLVNSSDFKRAVGECFKNKEHQKRFKYFVEKRERAGKILGTVVTFLGVGKVFSLLAKASKTASAVLSHGFVAGVVGYTGYKAVEVLIDRYYVHQECGNIPSLPCLMDVLYDLPEDHPDQVLIEEIKNSDINEEFVQSNLH